ncbi:MAG TPA: hypothetical protein DDY70_03435 [Clostridiales bacterium]|nr:hypothetical protein [Clostridiales bacterium]
MLPVGKHVGMRKITVYRNGELIDDFSLRLDYVNPCEEVFYDLRPYRGETLEFGCTPDVEVQDIQCAKKSEKNGQNLNYRPLIHFTPSHGWINDPNGLTEYTSPVTGEKIYHMFYQYNPYDTVWGNMHWGHATSRDLLEWKERPIALFPDESGTMFSGSAVVDKENRSGLKEGAEDVILLFYTCAGNTSLRSEKKEFTQCLAYSTDGGATFRKYAHNPLIPHIAANNRDPKVIYCEEMGRYVMGLYLYDANFVIFASDDLLHWEEIQKITIEGETECPDLYPLCADGDPKKRKWIISGASHIYIVCECKGGKFEQIQAPRRLNYGVHHYAAQTFFGRSDGRRIAMAWHRRLEFPRAPFNGEMSLPLELTLRSRGKEFDLCALPIGETAGLYGESETLRRQSITADEPLVLPLSPAAYRVRLNLGTIPSVLTLELFGQAIHIDGKKNTVTVGDSSFPLSVDDSDRRLTVIVDCCSAELFSGDGQAIMTAAMLCDYNICKLVLSSESSATVPFLEVTKLLSIKK